MCVWTHTHTHTHKGHVDTKTHTQAYAQRAPWPRPGVPLGLKQAPPPQPEVSAPSPSSGGQAWWWANTNKSQWPQVSILIGASPNRTISCCSVHSPPLLRGLTGGRPISWTVTRPLFGDQSSLLSKETTLPPPHQACVAAHIPHQIKLLFLCTGGPVILHHHPRANVLERALACVTGASEPSSDLTL